MDMSYDKMAQSIKDAVTILGMELQTLLEEHNEIQTEDLLKINDLVIDLADALEKTNALALLNAEELKQQKSIRTTNLIILGLNLLLFLGCWGFYVLN